MEPAPSDTMRAVVIDRFGGPETLTVREMPVPVVGPGDVLIRVETAGVGTWDPFEREGGYAKMLGVEPTFPYVLGSEGAGIVTAVGDAVTRFDEGDRVYAAGFLNPKGGFYADYAAVDADVVSTVPDQMETDQAGAMSGVSITALRGLDDVLHVRPGERVLIVGASGGIGHVAIQLAKAMGAEVLAVASRGDGVRLAERLGADAVVDGRTGDVRAASDAFAPNGIDVALITVGGAAAERALSGLRRDGRVAYPTGVEPEPEPRSGVEIHRYDGEPDRDIIKRLDTLLTRASFEVHIARTYPLERAADAHRALDAHYLGKLAFRTN